MQTSNAFLQRKVDAREAGIEHFDASTKTLERAVAGRTADADAAMGELARIEGLGVDTLRVPGNRRRFLAAASAAQIDEATALLNLPALERAQWLVDGPTVTLGELRDALASWPSADREEAADPALIRAVRARWPAAWRRSWAASLSTCRRRRWRTARLPPLCCAANATSPGRWLRQPKPTSRSWASATWTRHSPALSKAAF